MIRSAFVRRFTLAALAAALTACSEPTAPPVSEGVQPFLFGERKSGLIECPTDVSQTVSQVLGAAGGVISVGGHTVTVPPNALPFGGLSVVTLTAPASKYVEIEVHVDGLPHFEFAVPVTLVVSYSRCSRSNIDREPLRVWYINSVTKALINDMGGVDNKLTRTITVTTDHFSGYAIAQ